MQTGDACIKECGLCQISVLPFPWKGEQEPHTKPKAPWQPLFLATENRFRSRLTGSRYSPVSAIDSCQNLQSFMGITCFIPVIIHISLVLRLERQIVSRILELDSWEVLMKFPLKAPFFNLFEKSQNDRRCQDQDELNPLSPILRITSFCTPSTCDKNGNLGAKESWSTLFDKYLSYVFLVCKKE